ncbi:conserved hypothetical protein [Rhizobiales bacterium GAS191]|jgi:uncharacterized protein (TIGR02246 family)|nr:conserved hypothetical protein [Rhizobiales bacterium GAS191]
MSTPAKIEAATPLADLDIRAIYDRYVGTFGSRQPEDIVQLHAPSGTFWLHAGGKPVQGRGAIATTFAGFFRQWPQFGFEIYRVIFADRHWVLDWAATAVLKGPDGADRPVRFDCLDVVEVDEDGLVLRKDTFVDSAQVREALAAA